MQPIKIIIVALALMFAGCGGLPDMPSADSGTGEGETTGGNGASGSGMVAGSSEGSGSSGSSGGSSESGSSTGLGSSGTGTGSGGVVCMIEGLECLCGGLPSDPFECVDACLWVDGTHCMCDGMTAPPEWCESSDGSDSGGSTG